MKSFSIMIAAAALSLSACQSSTDASMVKAPSSVIAPLIGKTLVAESGASFIYNADGTVGGSMGDETVAGTYIVHTTDACTVFASPAQLKGKEFCSTPKISGDTVTFHRRDGSTSPTYKITG